MKGLTGGDFKEIDSNFSLIVTRMIKYYEKKKSCKLSKSTSTFNLVGKVVRHRTNYQQFNMNFID